MKITIFQTVLIALFILFAGIGLFLFSRNQSTNVSTIGTVTIWGPFPKTAVLQALSTLANTDKNLKSVNYVEVQPENFDQEYINAAAAGDPPDLVMITQEDLMALKPTLTPIPFGSGAGSLTARTYTDAFADGASVFADENGTYGIPFAIDPLVLYYNKTLLSSAGIAAPPTTWEAVTGLVPKVTSTGTNASIGESLIALGTYTNVHDARGILSALFFQAGVPITAQSTSGVHGSITGAVGTDGVSLGDAAVRFYTSFANPSQQSYTWNSSLPDSQQYFTAGKLALYIGYASEFGYLRDANPNLAFDVAPLPQPATATSRVSYGRIYAFAIPRAAKNPSGAFTVAVGLAGDAEAASLVPAAGSLAPASRSLLSKGSTDPYQTIFDDQALIAKGWLSPAPAETDVIFSSMIQGVITGRSTLDTALATAEQSITAALQKP